MEDDHTNLLLLWLLQDEEEEEYELLCLERKKPKKAHEMFAARNEEGAFNILICRHLLEDDTKFKEYFRLTPYMFNYVLQFIKDDLTKTSNNKHQNPISPEQQLCLTLR